MQNHSTTSVPRLCSFDGCSSPHRSIGLCSRHYHQQLRGRPLTNDKTFAPLFERLLAKVCIRGECWEWTGSTTNGGYGVIWKGEQQFRTHRLAYELFIGPIPKGLELDHLCSNPPCLRPEHLEAVTHKENCLRGVSPPAENARKTHCKRGHLFSDSNTYIVPRGGRECRICKRENWHKWWVSNHE